MTEKSVIINMSFNKANQCSLDVPAGVDYVVIRLTQLSTRFASLYNLIPTLSLLFDILLKLVVAMLFLYLFSLWPVFWCSHKINNRKINNVTLKGEVANL